MKKLLVACLLTLGSVSAFTVSAYNSDDDQAVRTEQITPAPAYDEENTPNQLPCNPEPCTEPCDTICTPAPCNPVPCEPAPCTPAPCEPGC